MNAHTYEETLGSPVLRVLACTAASLDSGYTVLSPTDLLINQGVWNLHCGGVEDAGKPSHMCHFEAGYSLTCLEAGL